MITTRKLKIKPVENEKWSFNDVYKFIRDEQYQQYRALNICMSLLYTENTLNSFNSGAENRFKAQIEQIENKIKKTKEKINKGKKEESINKNKELLKTLELDLQNLKKHYEESSKFRTDIDTNFKGMYIDDLYNTVQNQVDFKYKDNMSLVLSRAKEDFETARKNGLARGERSLTNYKRDFPLMVRSRELKICYDEDKKSYLIKWIKGIEFEIVIGRNDKNFLELQHTLHQVAQSVTTDNNYSICNSSIIVEGKEIILNLCLDIKVEHKNKFVEGRVVGVDLGMKIPAYVSLNDKFYIRKAIGYEKTLIDTTMQFKERLKHLQKQIKFATGGRGRKDKTRALTNLKDKEANFRRNYQHKISKEIVDFAIKNQASQINFELLSMKDSEESFVLSCWGYYQLQQMVEYKAKREGITVRYVDPYLTSQTCSRCGHYEEGQREKQETFECKKCGYKTNADYNASLNIARSDKYITDKTESEFYKKQKEEEKKKKEDKNKK